MDSIRVVRTVKRNDWADKGDDTRNRVELLGQKTIELMYAQRAKTITTLVIKLDDTYISTICFR